MTVPSSHGRGLSPGASANDRADRDVGGAKGLHADDVHVHWGHGRGLSPGHVSMGVSRWPSIA